METNDTPRLINGHYHLHGLVLPRVTTILNVLAKPELEAWKHRVGLDEAQRISEVATTLGTRVHAVCEAVNREEAAVWADELMPFQTAYSVWFDAAVADVLAVEQFVWHPVHRYGGTLDLLARLKDGRRAVIDLKTSKRLDVSYRLQLMAYAEALEAMGEPPPDVRIVVHLPSSRPGTLAVVEYDDDARDRKAWRATLRMYRWLERHKDDGQVTL
jgi:predicted RecB family nuclease